MMKTKKMLCAVVMVMMLAIMFTVPAFAAGTGDVAGAIEGTWTDASAQIKTVVNNVVFPVIDLVLAVFFFAKLGMAYFDYRKHGQFEWTAPAILFACLIFTPDGSHLCLDDPGNVKNYSENTGGRKQWNIQFQIHPEIKCFHWLTSCTSGLPGCAEQVQVHTASG